MKPERALEGNLIPVGNAFGIFDKRPILGIYYALLSTDAAEILQGIGVKRGGVIKKSVGGLWPQTLFFFYFRAGVETVCFAT